MEQKNTDIFELNHKSNNSEKPVNSFYVEDNPFLNAQQKRDHLRHLNDYDLNILQDGAYKDISDDAFKLEYKISRIENEMKALNSQIDAAKEINDISKMRELQYKLSAIKDDYNSLLMVYNDSTLSAKITGAFSNALNKAFGSKFTVLKSRTTDTFKLITSKLPEKIISALKIRKSLSALENINKSVDKLVKMTVPYGENIDKYQQLSKYIVKANSIQTEISEYLNNK